MAATIYIDTAPDVKTHNGHVLLTFASGGEKISLIVTQHASHHTLRRIALAVDSLFEGDTSAEVVTLPKRGRR